MKALSGTFASAALLVCSVLAAGQGTSHSFTPGGRQYHVDDRWIVSGPERPEIEYLANEDRVRSATFDDRAGSVLKAAESYTRAIFDFRSMALTKAATYTHRFSGEDRCSATNDTLVAQWEVEGPAGVGTLVLADDPMISTYTLRVPRPAISSYNDLIAFLNTVLAENKEPLNLRLSGIDFALPRPPGTTAFMGMTFRSPVPRLHDVLIHGSVAGNYGYLLVEVGKGLSADFYRLPHFVPERFPPLAELAHDWSFERILAEVGRDGCSDQRDNVLLAELVKRGLSAEQFVKLLTQTGTHSPEALVRRASATTGALAVAGRLTQLERYMEPALDAYSEIGASAGPAAAQLFNIARGSCSTAFERIALKHVGGDFQSGPFLYLGSCSSSKVTLDLLEGLRVPSSSADLLAKAVRSIRERISKQTGK